METDLLVNGVLWPTALAMALVVMSRSQRVRLVGVALAVAFVISAAAQERLELLPSIGSWTWIPVGVALAALVGSAAGARGGGRVGRAAACVVAALLAALLLPLPEWRADDARLVLAGAIALQSVLLLPIGTHRGGFSTWLAFSVALAGPSVVALATGFAKLAVPCGAVSFACGCMGCFALLQRPHRAMHAGICGAIVIATCASLGAVGAYAFETGGVPKIAFVLAAIAPLGCWLGEAPPFRGTQAASALARVVGAGVIAGLAVWFAASHRAAESDAYALRREPNPIQSFARALR